MSLLAVQGLSKRYGVVHAVSDVTFEIAVGEIFGLLGPNGAGKTTTIECILGLRRPDSGTIQIDGQTDLGIARQKIGAHLQQTQLQEKITPREALKLFGGFYPHSIPPDELIERFGLKEKANAPFDSLSGGQQQRLGLALAFVNDPSLLLLDEPTAGLDPQSRRELYALIQKMRDTGKSVLLTTHAIDGAEKLCDRVAILDHGKIVAAGRPAELITDAKSLEDVFIAVTSHSSESA